MSDPLFPHAYCPNCTISVIHELRAVADAVSPSCCDRAIIDCPECGTEIEFRLHWEATYCEILGHGPAKIDQSLTEWDLTP